MLKFLAVTFQIDTTADVKVGDTPAFEETVHLEEGEYCFQIPKLNQRRVQEFMTFDEQ